MRSRGILERPEPASAYETECVRPFLRGCLLPPEPVKKVEEFIARAKSCPRPEPDCAKLAQRINGLEGQRPALRQAKNAACRAVVREDLCRYRFRQLEAVIEAIALNALMYERGCLE